MQTSSLTRVPVVSRADPSLSSYNSVEVNIGNEYDDHPRTANAGYVFHIAFF